MSEEIKLLPCPFCGGKAEFIDNSDGTDWVPRQAQCSVCYVTTDRDIPRSEVATAWNRRTPSPDAVRQVEADKALLREALEALEETNAKFGTTKFIYEPARQRETLERLAPLTDTIIRARLVADRIKERLND